MLSTLFFCLLRFLDGENVPRLGAFVQRTKVCAGGTVDGLEY